MGRPGLRPRSSHPSTRGGKPLVVTAASLAADFDPTPGANAADFSATIATAGGPSQLGTAKRDRARTYEIIVSPAHALTTVQTTLGGERLALSAEDAVAHAVISRHQKVTGTRPRLRLSAPTALIANLSPHAARLIDFHLTRGEPNSMMGIALTEGWLGADPVLRDEFAKTAMGKMLQAQGYNLGQGGGLVELEISFHPLTKAPTYSIVANPN